MPYSRGYVRKRAFPRRRPGLRRTTRFVKRKLNFMSRRRTSYKRPLTKSSQRAKRIKAPARFSEFGFPQSIKGVLKSSIMSAAVDAPTGDFNFALINLVDMNNDQRTSTVFATNAGTSHIVVNVDGTMALLRTPYYFDEIAANYRNYVIRKVGWKLQVSNQLAASGADITVAYKVFKGNEGAMSSLLSTGSVEILKATPGMRFITLNPAIATRTGGRSKRTLSGFVNVIKLVTKRSYYTEAADVGPGEKAFSAAASWGPTITTGPRIIFWAWTTFSEGVIGADAMDASLQVSHYYTAYDKIIPGVS